MGFKENLITNWEDKTVEYLKKKFYIVKQFEYQGKNYLCGVNVDTLYDKETELAFLYKIDDDTFGYVDKQEEFEKLLDTVSGLFVGEIVEEAIKKYEHKK